MKRLCGATILLCCLTTQSGCVTEAVHDARNTYQPVNWRECLVDFEANQPVAGTELMLCPYCGAKPQKQGYGFSGSIEWKYICVECGGLTTTGGFNEDAVKKQWNFKVKGILHEKEVRAGGTR